MVEVQTPRPFSMPPPAEGLPPESDADEIQPVNVEFEGREFRVSDSGFALAPLIRVAQLAAQGVDANDLDGLAALGDLIETVLYDEDEYARFMSYATKKRADGDDFMGFVKKAINVLGERPTKRPSDASDGSPSTQQNSMDASTSRVVDRFVSQGRPDLALLVFEGAEDRAARAAS